jgi:hypothetical protein
MKVPEQTLVALQGDAAFCQATVDGLLLLMVVILVAAVRP